MGRWLLMLGRIPLRRARSAVLGGRSIGRSEGQPSSSARGLALLVVMLTALVAIQCGSPASQPPIGSAEAGASAAEAGASAAEAGTAQSEAGSDSDAGAGSGPVAEPPLPACAGQLDSSTATLFYDAARCLFEGDNAPHKGVAPGVIDAERVAVVRGRVLDSALAPLAGVRVTVAAHSELGSTATRTDGWFDLAVNGGGQVTLHYELSGRLPVQRHRAVPWAAFVVYPDVSLIEQGPESAVDMSDASNPVVVEKELSHDASGDRHSLLIFAPGTRATLFLASGRLMIRRTPPCWNGSGLARRLFTT